MSLTQINKAGLDEIALDHVFTIGASGSSAYTFQGEGLNGTVNNPTLYLTRGKTYRFENSTGGHPIRIQSTSGASGTAYNTGVTNNASAGTVIVEVQHDAPDVLYYQCTSHAAMNGILYITGALADGGVTTAKIADNAVTTAKLAVGSVTHDQLADNTVDADHLQSNAVTTAKIADDAVTSAKIADATIIAGNLASNSVTASQIANNVITDAKINPSAAIARTKLANVDLVDDTSPQLGGDLATNGNNIRFGDSSDGSSDDVLSFGASNDLLIYHYQDSSYIQDNGTGTLQIYTNGTDIRFKTSDGEVMAKMIKDGAVELYHNASKKLNTNSGGVDITGHAYFPDNNGTHFGAGEDLKIYHDGSNSYVKTTNTNTNLILEGAHGVDIKHGGENMAKFRPDSSVELYHDNSKRLETTSYGSQVTGYQVQTNFPVASVSHSGAVDLTNVVLTSSNFYNQTHINQGSHFNASTGRFTCPVDGVYRIFFRASEEDSTSSNVRLQKNGVTINEAYTKSGNHSVSSEAVIGCSANDYLQIQVNRLKAVSGGQHKQITFQLIA